MWTMMLYEEDHVERVSRCSPCPLYYTLCDSHVPLSVKRVRRIIIRVNVPICHLLQDHKSLSLAHSGTYVM